MAVTKRSPEKPDRTIEEWDAEIEAEYQRLVRQTKTASKNAGSKQKKWQRLGAMVPREWELRLKRATRNQHLPHGAGITLAAMVHRSRLVQPQGGRGDRLGGSDGGSWAVEAIGRERTRSTGATGADRGGTIQRPGSKGDPAPHSAQVGIEVKHDRSPAALFPGLR